MPILSQSIIWDECIMKHKENIFGHWRYVCGKNPNNQKLSPAKYVNVPKFNNWLIYEDGNEDNVREDVFECILQDQKKDLVRIYLVGNTNNLVH